MLVIDTTRSPQETQYLTHDENVSAHYRGLFQNEFNTTRKGNEEKLIGCDCIYCIGTSWHLVENGVDYKYLLVLFLGQLHMAVLGWFFYSQLSHHTQ